MHHSFNALLMTRRPRPTIMMMHHSFWWAVMHYHAVDRDASLVLMNELSLMHYGLPCRGPWCHHLFSSERAVMHYHAMGPWCITHSERAVMHYHAGDASPVLNELWCITMLVMHHSFWMSCDALRFTMLCAVMPSLILMNEPWCHHSFWWTSRDALMPYHAVLTRHSVP